MARGPGFFAGFLFGALAGAGAAYLFGTKSGEQMRRQLIENSGEWGQWLEDVPALARGAAETLAEAGRGIIDQQRLRFQEAVQESREAAAETKARMLAELEKSQRGEEGSR